MAKYRRDIAPEEGEELTYVEEISQAQGQSEPDTEDGAFKKRYGDLRRHTQQVMQQKDQEMAKMKEQLDQAARGQIKFPKTDEEIENWSNRYPDVAKIVDSIARKRANEAMEEGEKRMAGLKQLETKLTLKDAEQQLLQIHPDFSSIRQDTAFHEWAALQPISIQDALYKNNTDARTAARAIDLYKADTGNKKSAKKSAAQSVSKSSNVAPSSGKTGFSESQVDKMSAADYDKFEDAILTSMRTGNFVYDMSGGAR